MLHVAVNYMYTVYSVAYMYYTYNSQLTFILNPYGLERLYMYVYLIMYNTCTYMYMYTVYQKNNTNEEQHGMCIWFA